MADRVGGRPTATNGSAAAAPSFPPTKSQLYNRPAYRPRPPPPKRRRGRGCCCCCCLWLTFFIIALIFLAAIAGAVFYFIYRPQRPSFSVTSLRLSSFNVSASNALSSRIDLNITARNPNKKLSYLYDDITVSAYTDGLSIGQGLIPAFIHDPSNTTLLRASAVTSAASLDPSQAADLRKKTSLPLEMVMEGKAGVKIGALTTKKIGVRVRCVGVTAAVPKKGPAAATKSDASCKVKLRIKIWKWYL